MALKTKSVNFFLVFLIIFSITLVSSSQFEVSFPESKVLSVNEDYSLEVFVTNSSNGKRLSNTNINCSIELNYDNGSGLLNENLTKSADGFKHELLITKGNFSSLGSYPYNIYCEDSLGGNVEGEFIVTSKGIIISTGESIVLTILTFFSFIIFLVVSWFGVGLPFANPKNETNKVIGIERLKYAKMGAAYLSYAFFTWFINLVFIISSSINTLTEFSSFFEMIFNILMALVYPLFVVMIVIFFIVAARDLKLMDLLNRGITPR